MIWTPFPAKAQENTAEKGPLPAQKNFPLKKFCYIRLCKCASRTILTIFKSRRKPRCEYVGGGSPADHLIFDSKEQKMREKSNPLKKDREIFFQDDGTAEPPFFKDGSENP